MDAVAAGAEPGSRAATPGSAKGKHRPKSRDAAAKRARARGVPARVASGVSRTRLVFPAGTRPRSGARARRSGGARSRRATTTRPTRRRSSRRNSPRSSTATLSRTRTRRTRRAPTRS
jgi:hypothetical protein